MKNKYVFILAAAVILLFVIFYKEKKTSVNDNENDEEVVSEKKLNSTPPITSVSSTSTVQVSTDATAKMPLNNNAQLSENVLKQFATHLNNLSRCLALTNVQPVADKVEPNPDNLVTHLRSSLGDTVVQLDDWSQIEFVDKDSSKKRIRVDYDYPDGVTPNKRLSMYLINSYGAAEIINLTSDQTDNPNESFIESLKEGAQINSEERAARIYFSQGEELVFTIKNGKLQTLSIARADKAFNCTNLDEESSNCTCP